MQVKHVMYEIDPLTGTYGLCTGAVTQSIRLKVPSWCSDAAAPGSTHCGREREESPGSMSQGRGSPGAPKDACSYWTGGKRWAQENEATWAHYAPAHTLIGHKACTVTDTLFLLAMCSTGFIQQHY